MELRRWVFHALVKHQTITLEWSLVSQVVGWALWVLWPGEAFEHLPEYALIRQVPEWSVGTIFLVHGVGHAIVLLLHRKMVHQCRRAALATACLWSLVLGSQLVANPLDPVVAFYGVAIVFALWVFTRLWQRYPPHRRTLEA